MKVYELMQKLADAPAGAEVEVRRLMTLREFAECETTDDTINEDYYIVDGNVSSAEVDIDYVTLYFD